MAAKKHKNAEDRMKPFLSTAANGEFPLVMDAPNGSVKSSGGIDSMMHEGGGHDAWERTTSQAWRDDGNATGE